MANFSNLVSDRKFASQSKPSRNMPGPPAPWHAVPMALSAAIRAASSRFSSRAISRSVVTFCCESCSGAIRNTGTWTNLPSLATVTVRPPAAPPAVTSGWSLFSLWRTLTGTSPGPAAPGPAPVAREPEASPPVACTSPHASSLASSASSTTGLSSAPSSTILAAKRAPRYLPNERAGRYRWGPSVIDCVVFAAAPLTAPLTAPLDEPMGHGRTSICAGMPRWERANAPGSIGSRTWRAREKTEPSGAPARRTGLKTSSITRWSRSSSLTVQMNTAVSVDATSFSKMNAPSSPMPMRRL